MVALVLPSWASGANADVTAVEISLENADHATHAHAHAHAPTVPAPAQGISFLPEPTRGPVHLDSWLETSAGSPQVRLHYEWAILAPAHDAELTMFIDPALRPGMLTAQATVTLEDTGAAFLELEVPDEDVYEARLVLHAAGAPPGQLAFYDDRMHYLTRNPDGSAAAASGITWIAEGDAAVATELGTATRVGIDHDSTPDGETDSHCYVDFDAQIRTSTSTSLPSNMRDQAVPYITAAIYDPDGNQLARIVTSSDGTARFRSVEQNPCDENLQLKTELRWYNSNEKIRMSPTDSTNYWQQTWSYADIDDGETWTFNHGSSLSPQAYMLPQAREAYFGTKDTGREMPLVYIHRTQGADSPSGCSACALDDEIWFDGRTTSSEANDHTIYHEYGHNVHHQLAPSDRPTNSYGQHTGCSSSCHHWDSVHGTAGSAIGEAWANAYAAMVTDDETRRFNIENPDESRTDHTDLNCWGPNRECAVAAAFWDTYEVTGKDIDDFLDVLEENPQDVFDFEQIWDELGKPGGSNLDAFLRAVHITPNGDGSSQADAGGEFLSAVDGTSGNLEGVVSFDPHQSVADRDDYFIVPVGSGERVRVTMVPPGGQDLDLYLYDSTGTLVDSSELGAGTTEDVAGQANALTAGNWRFHVAQYDRSQGKYTWSIEYGDFDDLDPPEVTSAPTAVGSNAQVEICWQVPGFGDISHTNIHWGYTSGLPYATSAQSGEAPGDFCATVTAPTSGSIYYKLHAQGPSDNLYSDLRIINVVHYLLSDVVITQAPASVLPNAQFSVCWRVEGAGPVDHTDVHGLWDLVVVSTTRQTQSFTGTAGQSFCSTMQAPAAGTIELRGHAIGPISEIFGDPKVVRVLPYPDLGFLPAP